jgi:hypothetical protein
VIDGAPRGAVSCPELAESCSRPWGEVPCRRSARAGCPAVLFQQRLDGGSRHYDVPSEANAGDGAAGDGGVCRRARHTEGHRRLRHGHGQPRGGRGLKDPIRHWVIISRSARWRTRLTVVLPRPQTYASSQSSVGPPAGRRPSGYETYFDRLTGGGLWTAVVQIYALTWGDVACTVSWQGSRFRRSPERSWDFHGMPGWLQVFF